MGSRFASMVLPSVGLGTCLTYHLWRDEESRLQTRAKLLAAKRVWRALTCSAELILRYKWLSWRHSHDTPESFAERLSALHQSCAVSALELCRANGGLFTKLGQHAATLRPAVPQEYAETLAQLQDQAPARPLAEVSHTLQRELQLPPGGGLTGKASPFDEFDEVPVGSASLAQVHRARLHTGEEVAVKVQHSDIEAIINSDLHIIRYLDWLASLAFRREGFSFSWAIDELSANVMRELDFRLEAENAEKCRLFFARHAKLAERVVVPGIYKQYSSRRLLTMDFARGVPIASICAGVQKGEAEALKLAPTISRLLVDMFGAMIFADGFVHCDPHPGNLLVSIPPSPTADEALSKKGAATSGKAYSNDQVKLILLDHGLYRELSESSRLANCGLWICMVLRDAWGVRRQCARMGIDEQTAALLPLYFTNRASSTRAGLGQPVTEAQKAEIKEQLSQAGLLNSEGASGVVSFGGLNALADRLPGDMLFIMRTMHLVASLHKNLGGSPTERFSRYAEAAATGRWEIATSKAPTGPAAPQVLLLTVGYRAAQRLECVLLMLRLCLCELLIRFVRFFDGSSAQPKEQFSFARALAEP